MKKLLNKEWFVRIWVIIQPEYWFMLRRYSRVWDKELNQLMDIYVARLDRIDGEIHRIIFGSTMVWISNYPYGYGSKYTSGDFTKWTRPSRSTIYKLRQLEKRLKADESKNT